MFKVSNRVDKTLFWQGIDFLPSSHEFYQLVWSRSLFLEVEKAGKKAEKVTMDVTNQRTFFLVGHAKSFTISVEAEFFYGIIREFPVFFVPSSSRGHRLRGAVRKLGQSLQKNAKSVSTKASLR